ncbi:phosphatase PAP2 family protein [Pedobacter sp. Du54]|uniref:phosphatase PAP2 family protein n=1 Tax=Pedobacter anseongensis TaxID=3133439 RepID=UPI0030A52844
MERKILYAIVFLLGGFGSSPAQDLDLEGKVSDTAKYHPRPEPRGRNEKFFTIILPTAGMAYGFIKLGNHGLTDIDLKARYEFSIEHPHPRFIVDDYLQFAPGTAVLVLSGIGVKGKNRIVDQAGIYLVSNLLLNVFCQGLKNITAVPRPDGTSNSFPSGHTAEAFASAEFLRREYGGRSVFYGLAGYSSAFAVGYLRMYNNKHWLSDVVAGAGLGVLSTEAAYFLYPKIRRLFPDNGLAGNNRSMVYPSYSHGSYGITLSRGF